MKKLLLVIMTLGLCSCMSLRTVSLTSIPSKRDNKVMAQSSRVIFMGFNFDNDYVDNMVQDLRNQCNGGMVTGILTKDEIVDYFLMIVWKHQITATGYCLKPNQASLRKDQHRIPSSEDSSVSGDEI